MSRFLSDIAAAFVLGLLTPLTAVCVLPLYPGFLAYLSNQLAGKEADRKTALLIGLVITAGVVGFMLLLVLLFTTVLQVSLTNVIGIVSPTAFGILLVISILLILDIDVGRFVPQTRAPVAANPLLSALIYGFFFGAIVVPCNPAFIAAMLTRTIAVLDFVGNILRFLFFGIGMAFPLLVFSMISSASSRTVIGTLTRNKRIINLFADIHMLVISVYYLVFVFRIFGR